MDEYKAKKLKVCLGIIAVLVCIALVIAGHTMGFMSSASQGMVGLVLELIGLAGILGLLYIYNKQYTK